MNAKTHFSEIEKEAREITQNWFERVWNQQDEKAIYELMHPECEILGLGKEVPKGPDQFISFHQLFCQTLDDIHVELTEMYTVEFNICGHGKFTATHKKTGRPIDITFSFSGIAKDGQVHQALNVIDYLSMLIQIGTLEQDALPKALT